MIIVFAFMFFLMTGFHDGSISAEVLSEPEISEPAYAKWGRIAVEKAKERYPDAAIVDYLYVGSRKNGHIITETFKLWIQQPHREFGIFLMIERDAETDVIQSIHIVETPS